MCMHAHRPRKVICTDVVSFQNKIFQKVYLDPCCSPVPPEYCLH